MADDNWGQTTSSADVGASDGAFNTTDMQAALPTNGAKAMKPETPAGWAKQIEYNYEAFGKDAEHEWDGNAKVYEWDGETGDIGPEFPELEVQLFGEPGQRAKHGIDFSK